MLSLNSERFQIGFIVIFKYWLPFRNSWISWVDSIPQTLLHIDVVFLHLLKQTIPPVDIP